MKVYTKLAELRYLFILRFLNKVPEDSEHDAGDLLFDGVAEDVSEDGDYVELVHLLRQQRIESQHPQAEDQLVLDLHNRTER